MKKTLTLFLALCMIFSLFAFSASADSPKPITLNIAASYAEGSDFINNLQAACDAITEKTDGAVKFVIYTSNQLGSVADCMEQMLNGAYTIAESGMAVLSSYNPKAAVPAYPYVANDYDDIVTLVHSDWWKGVMDELKADHNMVPIMFFSAGYRNMIGNAEVRKAEDLAPCITRIGLGTIGQEFITACGGTPTTTSTFSDCYSALQTGVFELCEADLELLYNCALYEVSSCLSVTHHMLCPAVYSINGDVWDMISPENQQIILDEFEMAAKNIWDTATAKEEEWIQKFEETGITVIKNDEVDAESFMATVPYILEAEGVEASVFNEVNEILGK